MGSQWLVQAGAQAFALGEQALSVVDSSCCMVHLGVAQHSHRALSTTKCTYVGILHYLDVACAVDIWFAPLPLMPAMIKTPKNRHDKPISMQTCVSGVSSTELGSIVHAQFAGLCGPVYPRGGSIHAALACQDNAAVPYRFALPYTHKPAW